MGIHRDELFPPLNRGTTLDSADAISFVIVYIFVTGTMFKIAYDMGGGWHYLAVAWMFSPIIPYYWSKRKNATKRT